MVATAPVTVEQAAAILGVSASTVRRRIRAGSLRAEPARRPQGAVWLLHLPADVMGGTTEPPPATSAVATAPTASDAMITYTRSLLEPLVAALERSQGRVAALEREVGSLRAQLATLEAHQTHTAPNLGAEPGEPTTAPSDPPAEPPPPLAPDPLPPKRNGSGLWGRLAAWLMA